MKNRRTLITANAVKFNFGVSIADSNGSGFARILLVLVIASLGWPLQADVPEGREQAAVATVEGAEAALATTVNEGPDATKKSRQQIAAEKLEQEAEILSEFVDLDLGRRCISLQRIDRSEILSNQSIVFRLKGNKNYLNRLRYRCPGLAPRDTIMYETHSQRLCNLDSVTVLNDFGGRFLRGARCGLGLFYPVDDETVELLKGSRSERHPAKTGKGEVE